MIYDIFIIHRDTRNYLFHYQSSGSKMNFDESEFAEFVVILADLVREAGTLESLIMKDYKFSFEIFEKKIFVGIAAHEIDDFELSIVLERIGRHFLESYSVKTIEQFKDHKNSFRKYDIGWILDRTGKIILKNTDQITKSMIKRISDMIQTIDSLKEDVVFLTEQSWFDAMKVMQIEAMQNALQQKIS